MGVGVGVGVGAGVGVGVGLAEAATEGVGETRPPDGAAEADGLTGRTPDRDAEGCGTAAGRLTALGSGEGLADGLGSGWELSDTCDPPPTTV